LYYCCILLYLKFILYNVQWGILLRILSSGKLQSAAFCTFPLDLTSGWGLDTDNTIYSICHQVCNYWDQKYFVRSVRMFVVNLHTVFYKQLKWGVKHFCTQHHGVLSICQNVPSTNVIRFFSVYLHIFFGP
jgi:hypothetical protein